MRINIECCDYQERGREERSEAECWEPVGGEMSGFVPLNCPPIVTSVPFSVLGFVSETIQIILGSSCLKNCALERDDALAEYSISML